MLPCNNLLTPHLFRYVLMRVSQICVVPSACVERSWTVCSYAQACGQDTALLGHKTEAFYPHLGLEPLKWLIILTLTGMGGRVGHSSGPSTLTCCHRIPHNSGLSLVLDWSRGNTDSADSPHTRPVTQLQVKPGVGRPGVLITVLAAARPS